MKGTSIRLNTRTLTLRQYRLVMQAIQEAIEYNQGKLVGSIPAGRRWLRDVYEGRIQPDDNLTPKEIRQGWGKYLLRVRDKALLFMDLKRELKNGDVIRRRTK